MPPAPDLNDRLAAAGVEPGSESVEAWRRLRRHEGATVTVIELYELVARRHGLRPEQLPLSVRHDLARTVMPDVWPGWTTATGSERRGDTIEIVDYDPSWPDRYLGWERAIRDALGPVALRVEHVGSTSVPGLAAKPIIDLQVSVADLDAEASYIPPLQDLGLRLRSRDTLHRYFRPAADRPRDVHVHVCLQGSVWEDDHLLFRDHLRTDPEARAAYATVKRASVALWADDGIAYTEAKTATVLAILDQARAGRLDP